MRRWTRHRTTTAGHSESDAMEIFLAFDARIRHKYSPVQTLLCEIDRACSHRFPWLRRSSTWPMIDVGGPIWNLEVRKVANATAKAPRVAVAGPLISSVARPKLDLGDPPIVKIETPEQGREFVRKLAAHNPDYIKIWYIVRSCCLPVPAHRPPRSNRRRTRRSFVCRHGRHRGESCPTSYVSRCTRPSSRQRARRSRKAPTCSCTA